MEISRVCPSGYSAGERSVGGEFEVTSMRGWSFVFLSLLFVSATFAFSGIDPAVGLAAKVLFFLFLVLFGISILVPRDQRPRRSRNQVAHDDKRPDS